MHLFLAAIAAEPVRILRYIQAVLKGEARARGY
jgi:hypothetical protein